MYLMPKGGSLINALGPRYILFMKHNFQAAWTFSDKYYLVTEWRYKALL